METQRVHSGIIIHLLRNSVPGYAERTVDIEVPLKTTDDLDKLEENLQDQTTRSQL